MPQLVMLRYTFAAVLLLMVSCGGTPDDVPAAMNYQDELDKYTSFQLETDLTALTERERQMLPLLIEAADVMNGLFWKQSYGDRDSLLASIEDPAARQLAEINYGPWDRLANNAAFIPGVAAKADGAQFYPHDMTKGEFEAAVAASGDEGAALKSLYTLVQRGADGGLVAVPYSEAFRGELTIASEKLRAAAELADDPGLKRYLELRGDALLTDDYQPSDFAWMEMKDNTIDVVIGPIESYEDQMYGYKASFEAYVLVKDKEWSGRLEKYVAMLGELQDGLPVAAEYKQESPGSDSDLNAYDALYYAGDSNAGAKTIAINLPNDEEVQLQKGARRLQLKNSMQAKFEKILVPIAGVLIAEDQRANVDFDAFFANTMFHEVAHGLGIKETINGRGNVREAMKDHSAALEEGKADILGLYMVTELHGRGEMGDGELLDNYVTFLAGIFRSVRFGASSAHGVANTLRFNFFEEMGAFSRDEATRTYRVEFERMQEAVNALSEKILVLQGDGDYDGASQFVDEMGSIGYQLQTDLDRLEAANIPVDVVFEQGL